MVLRASEKVTRGVRESAKAADRFASCWGSFSWPLRGAEGRVLLAASCMVVGTVPGTTERGGVS